MIDNYQRVSILDQDEEFARTLGRHMTRPAYKLIMIDVAVFIGFMLFNALLTGALIDVLITLAKAYPRYEHQCMTDIVITTLLIGVVGAVLVCQACAARACNDLSLLWRIFRAR